MRNFTIYLSLILCTYLNQLCAQETFEAKAKAIADKIENITREEKAALKIDVEAVNQQLSAGAINAAQADERKLKLAEARAKSIETRIAAAQSELNQLVKDKVDGKIKETDTTGRYSLQINTPIQFKDRYKESIKRDSLRSDTRTTSQFVYSLGFNDLLSEDGKLADYTSAYYEWGLSFTTRILNNSNLLQFKYGLSLMYNNLEPKGDQFFVRNGQQTDLVQSEYDLDHSRLRNVYLNVPIHLEFDFGRSKNPGVFKKQQGWRLGLGGFAGARIKSKQILKYEIDGDKIEHRRKGDYNANDFAYGVSSYIGYKNMSLYAKYDLNPLFKDNVVEQNNISIGLRFDFD